MSEYPLITIGVSTYNRMDYLQESLESLLNQTYPNCEIIVVDDGSTDGTAGMMAEKFPHIKYVVKENGGDASAKNLAMQLAKGEYIVFNDSDDLFLPDAVERLYEAVKDHPGWISYGTYTTIDSKGDPLPTRSKVPHLPSGKITSTLLQHIIVNSCGTLIPTALLKSTGGYDASLRCCHDYKLSLQHSLQTGFAAVQAPVFLRRRHDSNLSSLSARGAYDKQKVVLDVLEEFVKNNTDALRPYEKLIRKRRADLHNKLAREAKKMGDKSTAKAHWKTALQNHFSLKVLWRYLFV